MDANNPNLQDIGSKAVADIKKDFVAMGAHRVHGWYAWAIVGIVAGMTWGVVYVSSWSNRQVTFDASHATILQDQNEMLATLDGTNLGNILLSLNQENPLESASIQSVSLTTSEAGEISMPFSAPQLFSLETESDWTYFKNILLDFVNQSSPIELTLASPTKQTSAYLVYGSNLSSAWVNALSADSGGGRTKTPPRPIDRCKCDIAISYNISCTMFEGDPGEREIKIVKCHASSGWCYPLYTPKPSELFTDSVRFNGKANLCETNADCSVEKCKKSSNPDVSVYNSAAAFVTKCKAFNITSTPDPMKPDTTSCQAVISAK